MPVTKYKPVELPKEAIEAISPFYCGLSSGPGSPVEEILYPNSQFKFVRTIYGFSISQRDRPVSYMGCEPARLRTVTIPWEQYADIAWSKMNISRAGILFAVITDKQLSDNPDLVPWIKSKGFKYVGSSTNPNMNHATTLNLFVCVPDASAYRRRLAGVNWYIQNTYIGMYGCCGANYYNRTTDAQSCREMMEEVSGRSGIVIELLSPEVTDKDNKTSTRLLRLAFGQYYPPTYTFVVHFRNPPKSIHASLEKEPKYEPIRV